MKKIIAIALIGIIMFVALACDANDAGSDDENPNSGLEDVPTPDIPVEVDMPPEGTEETPLPVSTPVDPTGGLERNADGILIGSAVFDAPVLLIGMPRIDPTTAINVRHEPNTDSMILGVIYRGDVVEAAEIIDGWYSVTVFPEMYAGFVRSDLLVPFELPDPVDSDSLPEEVGGPNEFSGTDPSGLLRGADNILIGSAEFDEPMLLMGMGNQSLVVIRVRMGPGTDRAFVDAEWGYVTIGKGQIVEATGVEDGWYRVTVLPGMFNGYIRSDLLVPYDSNKWYYAENIENYDTKMSPDEEVIAAGPLVDVRTIIPDIECRIIFATPDNFTGKPQYSRDVPLLQLGTALKLKEAQELFKQDGYRIKLYDAYRPSSVSGRLSQIIPDRNYIAKAGTSLHNRAAAVDMTLIDENGIELEMPSPMHTFNSTSHRNSSVMSAEARANMEYMTEIMVKVGLSKTVSSEWWHYGDSEYAKYKPMDIEFREITYVTNG